MVMEMESMMKRKVRHSFFLFVILFSLLSLTCVSAGETNTKEDLNLKAAHEIILDALSWKAFPFQCAIGDTLSGEFILTKNGDIFVGDQTKYDNWLLTGIDILILDESNYNLWVNDLSAAPLFEIQNVVELVWSVETPNEGRWYVIYFNDSIFIKQVDGSIHIASQNSFSTTLIVLGFISLSFLLALTFKFRRKI